jgi:hypothetical protein
MAFKKDVTSQPGSALFQGKTPPAERRHCWASVNAATAIYESCSSKAHDLRSADRSNHAWQHRGPSTRPPRRARSG